MSIYEDTYNAVLDLPCVQRIVKKNKKLRKENKALRSLIRSLPEFRQQPHCCSSYTQCSHDEPVKIKIEPGVTASASSAPVVHFDDIKIIKTLKVNPPENIVYDIEEAEEEAEREGDGDAHEPDDEGDAGAVDEAREDVAPELVGAEGVGQRATNRSISGLAAASDGSDLAASSRAARAERAAPSEC